MRTLTDFGAVVARMPRRVLIGGVFLVGLALATLAQDDPAGAAQRFVEASTRLDGLRISELTCTEKREEVLAQSGSASGLFLYFGLPAPQSSTNELTFRTVDENGDRASVSVSGQITAAILGFAQRTNVNTLFEMRRENGSWRYCGETSAAQ